MKRAAIKTSVGSLLLLASMAVVAHPWCESATFEQVQAVVGGNISKLDVIDEADMESVSCVYLDSQDLYNGLTLKFISDERLRKSGSRWSTAKAYFEEWTRGADAVAGTGEAAAWSDLTQGLYVLQGQIVVQLSAGKADVKDPAVQALFEALARQVLAQLP